MAADDGDDPFAPLGPEAAPPTRAPGVPAPRSRLSSSSMRRASPVRSSAPPVVVPASTVAPVAPARPATEVPSSAPGARSLRPRVVLAVVSALLVPIGGAAVLWSAGEDPSAARLATDAVDVTRPTPPVALGVDSESVDTEVLEGGALLVRHWVRTATPMERLRLEVPTGSGLDAADIEVEGLVVVADGADVEPPRLGDGAWSGTLPAASELYVEYVLDGVAQRSDSADGRALVTLTSLTAEVDDEPLGRVQVFSGAPVLTLACLAPGAASTPTLCGTLVDGTWTLRSEADALPATVIAQLDLQPGAARRR